MLEYSAFNTNVFEKVPTTAINILDVGCGTGIMGEILKEKVPGRRVSGVTYSEKEATIAKQVLDKVWVVDINQEIPDLEEMFDCMIFSHILEHTFHPENVLKNFIKYLKGGGIVIVALPNILYFKQRIELGKGNFQYSEKGGLMDSTHFRFFDWISAQNLVKASGLQMIDKEAVGNFPLPVIRRIIPSWSKLIDKKALALWPGLFGFQFVIVSQKIL